MEATVTVPFTDRKSGRIYLAGDTYSGGEDRIAELAGKGHVEDGRPAAAKDDAPSKDWKLPELKEYAAKLGLDASKLQAKDKVLELIAKAQEEGAPTEGEPEDETE